MCSTTSQPIIELLYRFICFSHAREQLQHQYSDKVHAEAHNSIFKNDSLKNIVPDPDVPVVVMANSPDSCQVQFSFSLHFVPHIGDNVCFVGLICNLEQNLKLGSGDRDEALLWIVGKLVNRGNWSSMDQASTTEIANTRWRMWLNPDSNHELVWDHGMCADTSKGAAVRDLIAKALKGPLAPAQQEDFIKGFWNLKKCEALVQKGYFYKAIAQIYFTVLVNMDMSPTFNGSCNRLTTAVELPKEFVRMYITNFKDLFIEVQAFCIEFSRIREAAALFRLLKTLE
ncbi:hypothetical protein D5086_031007 [Populus alba]|uniref:Uncharacterized protein n=1 Tax=Populus alba TaxID=43335 RepID=A0ACC4AQW4_POPAL